MWHKAMDTAEYIQRLAQDRCHWRACNAACQPSVQKTTAADDDQMTSMAVTMRPDQSRIHIVVCVAPYHCR